MENAVGLLQEKARKNVRAADHMATVTFNLFEDPKLLLGAAESLFVAVTSAMTAVLSHKRGRKEIPPFGEDFESTLRAFNRSCVKPLGIEKTHIQMIKDIHRIISEHRKSPVEFIRKDRFVICDGDYRMKTLTIEQIRQYVAWTKEFVRKTEEAIIK